MEWYSKRYYWLSMYDVCAVRNKGYGGRNWNAQKNGIETNHTSLDFLEFMATNQAERIFCWLRLVPWSFIPHPSLCINNGTGAQYGYFLQWLEDTNKQRIRVEPDMG